MAAVLLPLLIQESPVIIADIVTLFRKHPALTPEALAFLGAAIHAEKDDILATIAADQAAHPVP